MNIIELLDRTIKNKIKYWFIDKDIVVEHEPAYSRNKKCKDKCTYNKEPDVKRKDVKVYICNKCYHSIHIYKNRLTMRNYEAFL